MTELRQFTDQFSTPALKSEIEEFVIVKQYETGEWLQESGSYIQNIPILLKGVLRVSRDDQNGHELLLYYLNSGEACAMSVTCCLGEEKSKINVLAEEDSTVAFIPQTKAEEWMTIYPEWKAYIMRTYSHRFDELLNVIDSIAFQTMDQRLWKYLEKKFEASTDKVLKTTHQKIAEDLNTMREVVSRLLKALEKQGKVKLGRNKISLVS